MKKRLASLPLFLGGIIFIMSLLVPHHHHSESICFEYSLYNTIGETACDCCAHSSEPHESEEQDCPIDVLKDMEVLIQQPLSLDFQDYAVHGSLSNILFLLSFCSYLSILGVAVQKPVIYAHKILYDFIGTYGLTRRGPPNCVA